MPNIPSYDDDLAAPVPCICGRRIVHGTPGPTACGVADVRQCRFGGAMSSSERTREQRLARGVCVRCGERRVGSTAECRPCASEQAKARKARRQAMREAAIEAGEIDRQGCKPSRKS